MAAAHWSVALVITALVVLMSACGTSGWDGRYGACP